MPYIPPTKQRSSSLPFLQALPRWLSMDEAEERKAQQSENTRENARSFAASLFRRHKSESSADVNSLSCPESGSTSSLSSFSSASSASTSTSDHTDLAAASDMSDATECAPSASASGGASAALGRGIGVAEDGGGKSGDKSDDDNGHVNTTTTTTTPTTRDTRLLRGLFRNRVGEY